MRDQGHAAVGCIPGYEGEHVILGGWGGSVFLFCVFTGAGGGGTLCSPPRAGLARGRPHLFFLFFSYFIANGNKQATPLEKKRNSSTVESVLLEDYGLSQLPEAAGSSLFLMLCRLRNEVEKEVSD